VGRHVKIREARQRKGGPAGERSRRWRLTGTARPSFVAVVSVLAGFTDGNRAWLVQLRDVRLFEAAGNYTRVHFANEKPLINRALGDLEQKLDERTFFRANRHQIVNIKSVRSIETWFGGRLRVRLDDGNEVTLSRRRARAFRDLMSM
jgi:DNA-binding LytR/AlgR family response regulator